MLGETLTADVALAAGLITQIVAAEELQSKALAAARQLAQKPPQALAMTRQLMAWTGMIDAMEYEQNVFRDYLRKAEFTAAIAVLRKKFGLSE